VIGVLPGGPLDTHVALIGFMGAGKSTLGAEAAERIGRPFVDADREIEKRVGLSVSEIFENRGEGEFRALEERVVRELFEQLRPSVIALGGGAPESTSIQALLTMSATTVLVEIDVDTAWQRVRGSGRPLAADEREFRALYERRQVVYDDVADRRAREVDDVVLAAGWVGVEMGSFEELEVPRIDGAALVCDAHVAGIYGPAAQAALGSELRSTHELPRGEAAKTIASLEHLLGELRLSRLGRIVALGGGSTTDVAGFAAAVYLRGIPWVAVPTTLVAQVDAAIGGKTAVNLPQGKNLVGAFHWPEETVIDPVLLATLPEAEHRNGMAEVVKTGLLAGEPFWELPLPELVRRCAAYKTAVCLRDPFEEIERVYLNLGHTFAHALEAASDFRLPHGSAVALGLLAALRLSGLADERRVVEEVLEPKRAPVDRERAWTALKRDKKFTRDAIELVLLDEPGRPRLAHDVPEADVRRALDELIAG
jgi:shikimate kinase/3-dehydroquinate synthase